jgi:hypothetical protein
VQESFATGREVLVAPRRPETWIAKAGSALGNLALAILIVTVVPLALILVPLSVIWIVRALVTIAGGV